MPTHDKLSLIPPDHDLFSGLMPHDDRMRVSSIQRDDIAPDLLECPDRETYESELARVVSQAREDIEREGRGLAAVIANDRAGARRIASLLGDEAIALIDATPRCPQAES